MAFIVLFLGEERRHMINLDEEDLVAFAAGQERTDEDKEQVTKALTHEAKKINARTARQMLRSALECQVCFFSLFDPVSILFVLSLSPLSPLLIFSCLFSIVLCNNALFLFTPQVTACTDAAFHMICDLLSLNPNYSCARYDSYAGVERWIWGSTNDVLLKCTSLVGHVCTTVAARIQRYGVGELNHVLRVVSALCLAQGNKSGPDQYRPSLQACDQYLFQRIVSESFPVVYAADAIPVPRWTTTMTNKIKFNPRQQASSGNQGDQESVEVAQELLPDTLMQRIKRDNDSNSIDEEHHDIDNNAGDHYLYKVPLLPGLKNVV